MSISDQLNNQGQSDQINRIKNLGAIERIEAAGHKVELKGTEAVYIDDHLMVFFNLNTYENHRDNTRGSFETGEIEGLVK